MRTLYTALFALLPLLAPAQQLPAEKPESAGKMSIPAQLTRTVQADKAHPGDPVEFRTLEAVLADKGLVMPVNTRLLGRVLGAGPKQVNKNSWLLVVVERAEWKEHSMPLHAFVSAQITISQRNQPAADPGIAERTSPNPRRAGRQSARAALQSDPSLVRAPQDATETKPVDSGAKYPMLDNVGIIRDKNGATYLLSAKSNVKLPAGVLLMLKNEPSGSSETAEGKTASSTSADQP